jgi:putative membrane protein
MLWLKAVHIIAVAAWMAGMWYLPRLLIYHTGAAIGSPMSETFKLMERRLLRGIMNPAMVVTLLVGLWLATGDDWWSQPWIHAKVLLVVGMVVVHGMLARDVRLFKDDQRPRSARYYRVLNEVPTVLFIAIVVLVVVKPF